jgi:hypothetical protein
MYFKGQLQAAGNRARPNEVGVPGAGYQVPGLNTKATD